MKLFLICFGVIAAFLTNANVANSEELENVIYSIDFSNNENKNALSWLEKKGFTLHLGAQNLNPRFEDHSLILSTNDEEAGIIGKKFEPQQYLYNVKSIRIEWGVYKYPKGADWDNKINSVPIAVMLTFGTERISSGLPLNIKSAPYFLSAFIGRKEEENKAYTGKLYKKGGRYYCIASGDLSGKTIVTHFEVDNRFKEAFGKKETPPITAFAFQMNTKGTEGESKAFLRKVEFIAK